MQFPHSKALIDTVIARKPMHRKFLNTTVSKLSEAEQAEAEHYIAFLQLQGHTTDSLAASYLTIVDDTFREELHFRETGRYRCSSYAEAAAAVYHNPEYMQRYMVGLALSSFWWINHVELRRFFTSHISGRKGVLYREVGPGHGLYFLEAMRTSNFERYEGVDISETSVAMTRHIIDSGHFGRFAKANVMQADFLAGEQREAADMLVMGEILEHVETPGRFLACAHACTTPEASIFLTTCFNSPAVDHIYNPGSMAALEQLVQAEGFAVTASLVIPKQGTTLAQCEADRLPVNVAMVLKKA
jgi:2-polyprenyl-3-methyl-5-hydroxy-6-metoxy-1,4-benzoquinol methylase